MLIYIAKSYSLGNIIGCVQNCKLMVENPDFERNAIIGMTMLEWYTSNVLGVKFINIIEKWARKII